MKKYIKPIITLMILSIFFTYIIKIMGASNMFNTIMNTSYDLLLNTVLYIMSIAVITGAFSAVLSYTRVIDLINLILSPLMRPIYGLPGAASLGIISTFFSDNPAMIALIKDKGFIKHFKYYEVPCLCNLGTSFGMGFIVWIFMGSQGNNGEFLKPATIGLVGAFIGSIITTRLMLYFSKKKMINNSDYLDFSSSEEKEQEESNFLDAILNGGKKGVEVGIEIIPGVLIICSFVMLLVSGPSNINGSLQYTGSAYEGINLIGIFGKRTLSLFNKLFGFTSLESITFPLTALGSVGASLGLVPELVKNKLITPNDIAVFTAMGMCWSGYLSTHIAMMDSLNLRSLVKTSILIHTFGGLCAGISAHLIYMIV
ncbi:CD0519/CD1768 family membrane protein [Peptoniphilus stercorisuis]|uniref:Transporter gate domain protein n=1 Tax=Peptoniphilus stercorisuis TaxID=1436965 RepID=A0ABS4KCV3_9FIRM|nr:hypothetical protein [Peptoniphilus stercorisuis]MBP2025614.1 hypothetical protein [Peptoniphilus stercorisuis]